MKKVHFTKTPLFAALWVVMAALMPGIGNTAKAQQKVNDGSVAATAINADAIAEYQTNKRGILLPRVALTATTAAAPLTAHIAGMTVYNTATAGTSPTNVTPGWYYNDGTKWVRLLTATNSTLTYGSGAPVGSCTEGLYTDTLSTSPTVGQQWTCSGGAWVSYVAPSATEWYLGGSTNDAGSNKTSAITRKGAVGINTTNPSTYLHVTSPTSGAIRIVDGTQATGRYLTSDANGVGTWTDFQERTRSSVSGTAGSASGVSCATATITGASITLPKGSWTIVAAGSVTGGTLTYSSTGFPFYQVALNTTAGTAANVDGFLRTEPYVLSTGLFFGVSYNVNITSASATFQLTTSVCSITGTANVAVTFFNATN